MSFLDRLAEVTARVRAGEPPQVDELMALKHENRRLAEEAEHQDRACLDSLPTWINTTNSTVCNLKCLFCNQAYGRGVDIRMQDVIYRQVVEELYPAVETVELSTYGEPMMTPHIHDKFAEMERFGVKCDMITNGTLMKGDVLLERMSRIMGNLYVSIDGARAETYNRLRVGSDLHAVLDNIRRYNHFRHQRPKTEQAPLHLFYILMRSTLDELPDFVRLARELDAQTVRTTHLVLFEEAARSEMISDDPEWRRRANEVLAQTQEVADQLGQPVMLPPPFAEDGHTTVPGSAPKPIRCYFLWQRMYVGPTGNVIPCALAGIHANGNCRGSTFAEQWNSELYQDMRRRVHSNAPHEPCATCYLVHRVPAGAKYDFT